MRSSRPAALRGETSARPPSSGWPRVSTRRRATTSVRPSRRCSAAGRWSSGLPSRGMTARGQFAYRPDGELIRARITRESPTYDAPFTVIVQNGSGEVGVGRAVAERLAVLDVDLEPVTNASSFDFKATQILAGDKALAAAEDVRAILGRGVVLKGRDLPDDTIVVIVGKDLKAKDLQ